MRDTMLCMLIMKIKDFVARVIKLWAGHETITFEYPKDSAAKSRKQAQRQDTSLLLPVVYCSPHQLS